MMTTSSASEALVLRAGRAIPTAAWELLLDLERRGVHVHIDPRDEALVCRPRHSLTERDKQSIVTHRAALKALALDCEAIH